ncbi:MAG: GWxTD domain-containing protein [Candidatus Marinimicrobia bacterium]|nr:GWxTD domain-containing protein [Candidatus Neomarinimicrobiota bacterium]
MKILKTFLIFLFVIQIGYAQKMRSQHRDLKTSNVEQFHITIAPMAGEEIDRILLNTYIMIPSYALQFVKVKGGFQSRFETRIILLDEDGHQLYSKSISQTLTAADYLETVSRTNWYYVDHTFSVETKKYKVVCELFDLDTRNSGVKEKSIDLTQYNSDFTLYPPLIMTQYKGTWQGGKKLLPSFNNEINPQQSFISVHISGKVAAEDYSVKLILSDMKDELIAQLDSTFNNSVSFFTQKLRLPIEEVHGLRVKLDVTLEQNGKTQKQHIELKIKRPGVSSLIRDIHEAIDQMKYILTSDERKQLSKARKNDKEALFYEFWKKRNPSPNTNGNELMDQYYIRVAYANEHFTSFAPGWKNDMGMIYILFGPPDDIDRTFMSSNRNARQTWHYYRVNRSFTFYDENGFGDYRLTTPYFSGRAW